MLDARAETLEIAGDRIAGAPSGAKVEADAQTVIGDIIELQFLGNSYNPNLGSAISLVLMVVVLLCMSIMSNFDDEEMEGRIL